MKDTRTISNTTREEIAAVLSKVEKKAERAWKKPKMCAAPECKTIFTPRREWQKFCSTRCQQAIAIQEAERKAHRPFVIILELEKEIVELKAEIAKLKGEK